MITEMRKRAFTIVTVLFALVFWFFDSIVHHLIYKEPEFHLVPEDFNELWMRSMIVALIVLFGIFADYFTAKIMFKQKQLEVAYLYSSLISASRDILENLVNQMRLFRIEADRSKDFDRNVIRYYDNAIKQASELVLTLSNVEEALKGANSSAGSDDAGAGKDDRE